jgi:hypothetical protein
MRDADDRRGQASTGARSAGAASAATGSGFSRAWRAALAALAASFVSTALVACGGSDGGGARGADDAATAGQADAGATAADVKAKAAAKETQCNALIGVINDGVMRLESTTHGMADSSGIGDLNRMADTMEETAGIAAKLQLTDPELVRLGGEYVTMARDVVRAARRMGMAAQAKDATAIAAAHRDMEAAVKREDPLVDELNRFCQEG